VVMDQPPVAEDAPMLPVVPDQLHHEDPVEVIPVIPDEEVPVGRAEANAPADIPVRPLVGLENLIRDLNEGMDELYREGRLAPDPSSCTSLGSTDEVVNYVLVGKTSEYCTCDHGDVEVSSGHTADDDILIWCCGHYRSINE